MSICSRCPSTSLSWTLPSPHPLCAFSAITPTFANANAKQLPNDSLSMSCVHHPGATNPSCVSSHAALLKVEEADVTFSNAMSLLLSSTDETKCAPCANWLELPAEQNVFPPPLEPSLAHYVDLRFCLRARQLSYYAQLAHTKRSCPATRPQKLYGTLTPCHVEVCQSGFTSSIIPPKPFQFDVQKPYRARGGQHTCPNCHIARFSSPLSVLRHPRLPPIS